MKRAIIICLFALVGMAQGARADDYVTDVMIAVGTDTGQHTIINCLADGTYTDCAGIDLIAGGNTKTVTNCYKTQDIGEQGTYTTATGRTLVNQFGNRWEVCDDKVVPKMTRSEVFENVCITAYTPMTVTSKYVDFVGTFDPVNIGNS